MITDKHFIDWHSDVFGYGYGTGEQYTIPTLKKFLELCDRSENGGYSFEVLEKELGSTACWLLINILASWPCDIIDYGTSPRFGWLTDKGNLLKEYVIGKTEDELYELAMSPSEDNITCSRDYCNCDIPCRNPLFSKGD